MVSKLAVPHLFFKHPGEEAHSSECWCRERGFDLPSLDANSSYSWRKLTARQAEKVL